MWTADKLNITKGNNMKTLMERVKEDIKENPDQLEKYLKILADAGMLNGTNVKLNKVSKELLNKLNDNKVTVYIK